MKPEVDCKKLYENIQRCLANQQQACASSLNVAALQKYCAPVSATPAGWTSQASGFTPYRGSRLAAPPYHLEK